MKIKVTFEKIYDADEFYAGDCEDLTFDKFKNEILDLLLEWSDDEITPNLNFEEIEE